MTGLLIAALGMALGAWHARALRGQRSLHPAFLKTRVGSFALYGFALACVFGGGLLTIRFLGPRGLVMVAATSLVLWIFSSARSGLTRELQWSLDAFRREYPELDEEALFRFVVHERHPEWDSRRIQDVTEDCPSLSELARRLKKEETQR